MAGRPGYIRGYGAPRAGAFSGRSGSLLSRSFARNSVLRQLDWILVVVVAGLSAIGVLLVWSATEPSLAASGQDPRTYLKKQLLWVVIGLGLMFAVSFADSRRLRSWTPAAYLVTLLGLGAVLTPLGQEVNGARAWIDLPGGFQVEPSEFAKVVLILAIATVFSQPRWGATLGLRSVLLALAVAAPLIALVIIEPALGVAMVLVVVTATMTVLSGARLRVLAGVTAAVAAAIAVASGTHLVKDYQLTRFTSFLHPVGRPGRRRLQRGPGQDRGGLGRDVRRGPVPRPAGRGQLRALPADGLHIHRGRRGAGLRRRHHHRRADRRRGGPRAAHRGPGR